MCDTTVKSFIGRGKNLPKYPIEFLPNGIGTNCFRGRITKVNDTHVIVKTDNGHKSVSINTRARRAK